MDNTKEIKTNNEMYDSEEDNEFVDNEFDEVYITNNDTFSCDTIKDYDHYENDDDEGVYKPDVGYDSDTDPISDRLEKEYKLRPLVFV